MSDIKKLPDQETGKVDYDSRFRRNTGIETVMSHEKENGWVYKGVITNYPAAAGAKLVHNFENHRKAGFEIVLTTDNIKDDRVFGPNSNQRESTVPVPLTGKTDDGFEYVVMRIRESDFKAHLLKREKEDHEKYLKMLNAETVSKKRYEEKEGFSATEYDIKSKDSKL